jgi:hypothetical protein
MTLTYSLQTASDLYAKLKRDAVALDERVTGDGLFNLVVTGYHLAEWIRKDPTAATDIKARLGEVQSHLIMRVCGDLANASKHFVQRGKDSIKSAESTQGFGMGRYVKGPYGVGEESIQLTLEDGALVGAIEFSRRLLAVHSYVFEGGVMPA